MYIIIISIFWKSDRDSFLTGIYIYYIYIFIQTCILVSYTEDNNTNQQGNLPSTLNELTVSKMVAVPAGTPEVEALPADVIHVFRRRPVEQQALVDIVCLLLRLHFVSLPDRGHVTIPALNAWMVKGMID